MKCSTLVLPVLAGMVFFAPKTNAKTDRQNAVITAKNTLHFIENKGQVRDQYGQSRKDIHFRLPVGKGLNIFIGKGKLEYQWAVPADKRQQEPDDHVAVRSPRPSKEYRFGRMDVQLLHTNPGATLITEQPGSYYERYYLPFADPEGIKVRSYQKIIYRNIYPNIDWVIYIRPEDVLFSSTGKPHLTSPARKAGPEELKYDFIVRPGGNVSDIKIKYSGATALTLNRDGSLSAITPMGGIGEQAPISYTQGGRVVDSRFVLSGDVLSYHVAPYTGTLVIDPVLQWSTYCGGLGNDQPSGVVTDSLGNVYLSGGTLSTDNIATTGSYQATYGGSTAGAYLMGDAFLAKYDADGNRLWASYYGGTEEDRGLSLSIDKASGSLYLAGSTTSSTGIATTGAYQSIYGGNTDAFLARFNTSGQRIWATYYGGPFADGDTYFSVATTCDLNGNVYLAGETISATGIATAGSHQVSKADGRDAYLVKFSAAGNRLWATYFGGNGQDYPNALACDSNGYVWMAGTTDGTDGIATTGSFQTVNAGLSDAFISRWSPQGVLSWASYLGGSGYDEITAMTPGQSGNVYASGSTESLSGIATTNSFQPAYGGGPLDGFVTSFSSSGQRNWASYYGGPDIDAATGIAYSAQGKLFLSGYTISASSMTTTGSLMDTLYQGTSESFLARFDLAGQREWGTYFGGSGYEINTFLATDASEQVYLCGQTSSAEGLSTTNSQQPGFGGGDNDAYLARIDFCTAPASPAGINGAIEICSGTPYTYAVTPVAGAVAYIWDLPAGWSGSSDSASIVLTPDGSSGTLSVSALSSCSTGSPAILDINVIPAPQPQIVRNGNILSTTMVYPAYQWILDGQDISGANAATYVLTGPGQYKVRVTGSNGCSGTSDTIHEGTVGIPEQPGTHHQINVYPNPATDEVNIMAPFPVWVRVSGIDGREYLSLRKATKISVKDLAPGIYFLQVYAGPGSGPETLKLVIRKK